MAQLSPARATMQRGNVLFIILIAVALFAFLAYAVTKSSNFTNNASTQEGNKLAASELIQFGDGLRIIIERMVMGEGVEESNASGNGLLFAATGANASYGVLGTQPRTEIFNKLGGGATFQAPPTTACSGCAYEFTGQLLVTGVNSDSKYELSMVVLGVSADVCAQINTMQRLGWSSVPTAGEITLLRFTGTNYGDTGGSNTLTLTGASNEFVGKKSFCYRENAGAARYVFVHVLRGR